MDAGDPAAPSVLENLLGNAWKFTRKRAGREIEFGRTRQRRASVYFVRDNGAGFDMAYADKLFGVFQRLHTATSSRAPAWAWPPCSASSVATAAASGREGRVGQGATFYFTLSSARPEDPP